jgi:thiamine-phosphate pyrophosphorylase
MRAGEAGADYVMFGDPARDGWRPDFDTILERVAWWAELFAIPCVAYANSLDEVWPLSSTGAEFIGLGDRFFSDTPDMTSALREAARALKAPDHRK